MQCLKGHSLAPGVLCLSQNTADNLLASGDERGVVRVWNLGTGRVYKALKIPNSQEVMAICFNPVHPLMLYIAVGKEVLEFDLNADGMILSTPLRRFRFAEDEINQIDVNQNGTQLAIADDSGKVSLVDLKSGAGSEILPQHENLCTCVKFRKNRPFEVISGSMDKDVAIRNCKTKTILHHFDTVLSSPSKTSINPPFVTSLDVHPSGNIFAVGLGDGGILIFQYTQIKSKKKVKGRITLTDIDERVPWRWMKIEAHTWTVTSLSFVSDNVLVSAALDGYIMIWDLSKSAEHEELEVTISNPPPELCGQTGSPPFLASRYNTQRKINCVAAVKTDDGIVIYVSGTVKIDGKKTNDGDIEIVKFNSNENFISS